MNRFLPIILVLGQFHCRPARIDDREVAMENTKWVLAEMNGIPLTTMTDFRVVYFTLDKNNASISGYAGCNSIAGGYNLSDNKISFTVASTRMMCSPTVMEVEQFLLNALSSADSYRINGIVLQLFQGETSLAILKAQNP